MRSYSFYLLSILFIGIVLSFTNCKKKCKDVQSNQAPFRTYTIISDVERNGKPTDVIVEEDTFFVGGQVVFESLVDKALKYEWKIQGDPNTKEGKKIALYFQEPSVRAGDILEVMSIVTRTPNPECISGDDGVDTLIKKIHFIDFKTNAPFAGEYRIHEEINTPNQYYNIKVRYQSEDPTFNGPQYAYLIEGGLFQKYPLCFYVVNSPNCFAFTLDKGVWGWQNGSYQPDYSKGEPYCYLSSDRKSITIEGIFTELNNKGDILNKNLRFKFTGKKIN